MDKELKLRAKISNDFWYEYQNSPKIGATYPEVQEIEIRMDFATMKVLRKK